MEYTEAKEPWFADAYPRVVGLGPANGVDGPRRPYRSVTVHKVERQSLRRVI